MITVPAMAGPSAWKKSSVPARSAALPAATISPAVSTVGKYSAVAFVAASTFSASRSRRLRIAVRKKTA